MPPTTMTTAAKLLLRGPRKKLISCSARTKVVAFAATKNELDRSFSASAKTWKIARLRAKLTCLQTAVNRAMITLDAEPKNAAVPIKPNKSNAS
jgi:hypothetical protein